MKVFILHQTCFCFLGKVISTLFDVFPTRCNFTQFIYFWKTALQVSGGNSTHHQEHIQLYIQYMILVKMLMLPAAIVDYLELV